jgi:hypothetical protein
MVKKEQPVVEKTEEKKAVIVTAPPLTPLEAAAKGILRD